MTLGRRAIRLSEYKKDQHYCWSFFLFEIGVYYFTSNQV